MKCRVVWTRRAEADIRKSYIFNLDSLGEKRAWEIARDIYHFSEQILSKEYLSKVRDQQFAHMEKEYFKLFRGNYRITYRIEGDIRFVIRVFDMRQHPDKNLVWR